MDIYSVTELNQEIKGMLEGHLPFRNLFVQGEVSNYKAHSSGHHYFTLKDENAAINAVMFRSDATRLRFRLENGMHVIARGRISSFPKSGQVQMYVADCVPDGAGALHMAFEQRKQQLFAEGLFEEALKRSIPTYPQVIALITSPTGAAVRDMVRILTRRWPLAKVQLYPSLVQGTDAPRDLRRALALVQKRGEAQVIILGRGGGSMEDLWAFNDEQLARDIRRSKIPVISAVGHEPDVTISDFVADLRAPTPSGAAELAVPDCVEIGQRLQRLTALLHQAYQAKLHAGKQQLNSVQHRLSLRTPAHVIVDKQLLLDHFTQRLLCCTPQKQIYNQKAALGQLTETLQRCGHMHLVQKRAQLIKMVTALDVLSPLKVLSRGYALALDDQGRPVLDSAALTQGQRLEVRFAKGRTICKVMDIEKETQADGCQKKGKL